MALYQQSEEVRLTKEIGQRIRDARLSKIPKVTQERLGEAVGTSFQMIQKYENGKCRICAAKLILVAQALEVSPAFLLTGKPSRKA